jgi:hypothetical protein
MIDEPEDPVDRQSAIVTRAARPVTADADALEWAIAAARHARTTERAHCWTAADREAEQLRGWLRRIREGCIYDQTAGFREHTQEHCNAALRGVPVGSSHVTALHRGIEALAATVASVPVPAALATAVAELCALAGVDPVPRLRVLP